MKRWDIERILVLAGSLSIWLAAGIFFAFDYVALFTGEPIMTGLLLLGLVFVVWLAVRPRPWLYLTAALVSMIVPAIVLFVFGGIASLGDPLGGSGYAGAWVMLLAIVLMVPAGIRGFVLRRRTQGVPPLREAWGGTQALAAVFAVALALGMSTAGGLATGAIQESGFGDGYDFAASEIGGESLSLAIRDFEFVGALDITAGVPTEIVLTNEDADPHTFTYVRGGVEYDHWLVPGAESKVLVLFSEPGTVLFRCVPHSESYEDDPDESMVGSIAVVAAE